MYIRYTIRSIKCSTFLIVYRPIPVPSLPTYSSRRAQKYRSFNNNNWAKKNKKGLKNNEISETRREDFTHNDRQLVPSRLEGMSHIVYTVYMYLIYHNFMQRFFYLSQYLFQQIDICMSIRKPITHVITRKTTVATMPVYQKKILSLCIKSHILFERIIRMPYSKGSLQVCILSI